MKTRTKTIRKIILIDILVLVAVIAMFIFLNVRQKDAFTYKGDYKKLSLEGTWYQVNMDEISIATFTKDGKYKVTDEEENLIQSGTYEIGNHMLKMDDRIFKMNYVDEKADLKKQLEKGEKLSEYELRKYFYTVDDKKEKVYYFSNEVSASDQLEDNCSTNEYYEKIGLFDENGFAIDGDGALLAYIGQAAEITLPEEVTEVTENAVALDYERAEHTDKITIPGTVRKIDSGAFSFSNIKEVHIEQGVEEIDTWAFGDSYIEDLYFPDSIAVMQPGILDTEEGLEGLRIHCKQNSQVDTYFKNNPPEGDYEIIYE